MIVTHLVLLIGTNPLPNFVSAQYLLQKYPEINAISMICSSETGSYATSLKDLLQSKNSNRTLDFMTVELEDVGNDELIRQNVRVQLLENIGSQTHLHLNYTGGTKAMVTHVYQTLRQAEASLASLTFSYLDARKFSLRFDQSAAIASEDLRETIHLSLGELISLHGFVEKSKKHLTDLGNARLQFPEANQLFRNFLAENGDLDTEYFNSEFGFKREMYLKKNDTRGNLSTSPSHLDQAKFSDFQASGLFLDVCQKLPVRLFNQQGQFNLSAQQACQHLDDQSQVNSKEFEKTIDYLAGIWLEEYVLDCLKRAYPEQPFWVNWRIRKEGWNSNNDFELDVIFLKGYQLVAISCTTDSKKKMCKSKGFEILLRSRQIGGDEARSIVICMANQNDSQQIESELKTDTGSHTDAPANVRVLGKDQLHPDVLIAEIRRFIEE